MSTGQIDPARNREKAPDHPNLEALASPRITAETGFLYGYCVTVVSIGHLVTLARAGSHLLDNLAWTTIGYVEWVQCGGPISLISACLPNILRSIKLVGDAGLPLNREHWAINSAATIVPTGSFVSADLLTEPHLMLGVSRTLSVDTDANSSADVIPTFQPTPYAKLVCIPRSAELLGHTAHWRTDGIGVLLLLDALLALASGPSSLTDSASLAWGTEVVHLAPAVEDAAAMPKESTPELKERGRRPRGHPAPTTRSPTAARDKHYTSTVRFALRPYLLEPYSTPAFAAGPYTTGWMKRVESRGALGGASP
ncbi:hypothetical protein DL765_010193 [Monosporascus sp. GIB2]|nr:hypothetical protein DL765_010193 [Monosporascus sp. GIB2]